LEEFPAGEEEYPAKLLPAIRNTNGSKGFCENFRLGKEISGKTPGFIRGAGKGTGTFLQCIGKWIRKSHTILVTLSVKDYTN
jgi:hypothetical protein